MAKKPPQGMESERWAGDMEDRNTYVDRFEGMIARQGRPPSPTRVSAPVMLGSFRRSPRNQFPPQPPACPSCAIRNHWRHAALEAVSIHHPRCG